MGCRKTLLERHYNEKISHVVYDGGKHATMKKNKYARACKGERVMKRILRMAGAVMVCMALGFATVGTDIQTVYAQEEVRGAGTQTADG